jgi:hypothetical protein
MNGVKIPTDKLTKLGTAIGSSVAAFLDIAYWISNI